ncbi:MAG: hypothetical protein IPM46_15060 [Flavobacteriales bacterium]|nr:hypothetical protein [Flavobacteriales bacterium]
MVAAAQGILERRVTVHAENVRLGNALTLIAQDGKFRLSYNAAAVPADSIVTLHAEDWTVQRALRAVLPAGLPWKESGNHLIITAAPGRKQRFDLEGAITDGSNGAPVSGATVFELRKSNAVATDAKGAFRIALSGELERTPLLIARSGYQDTVVFVERGAAARVALRPIPPVERIDPICHFDRCGVEDLGTARLLVPASRMQFAENLGYAERRAFQLSLVPGVSTNGPIAGAVVNEVSVNVLAGYARGLDGLEIGGGANLLSHDMKGVQIAGIGNLVGGTVRGVQFAGGVNHSMRAMKGLQVAGFSNTVWDTLSGVQVSGGVNLVKRGMSGTQVSGAANVAFGDLDGVQVSGGANVVTGVVNKAQVSGAANYAKAVKGAQVSGGVNISLGEVGGGQVGFGANYAGSVTGGQVSFGANVVPGEVSGGQVGFGLNYAGNVTGGQFSFGANVVPGSVDKGQVGFGLNYAGNVTGGQFSFGLNVVPGTAEGGQVGAVNFGRRVVGGQVGIINISDTLSGGSVGLFSFSLKGYHRVDVISNDVMPLSVQFRTGTRAFHNILGYSPAVTPDERWGFLYGFGFEPRFSQSLFLNIDLTAEQIVEQREWVDAVNILGRFSITPGVLIRERFTITAGLVANVLFSNWRDVFTGQYRSALPRAELAYNDQMDDLRLSGWLGWRAGVGVRF